MSTIQFTLYTKRVFIAARVLRIDFAISERWGKNLEKSHWHIIAKSIRNTLYAVRCNAYSFSVYCIVLYIRLFVRVCAWERLARDCVKRCQFRKNRNWLGLNSNILIFKKSLKTISVFQYIDIRISIFPTLLNMTNERKDVLFAKKYYMIPDN